MGNGILSLSYLIGSVSFIYGLKMLSHPDTARRGNLYAAVGMTLAIFATIFLYTDKDGVGLGNYTWIFAGLIIGSIIGTIIAKKVLMTAMPQMVSLFNGMGGACAAIISIVEFKHMIHSGVTVADEPVLTTVILLGLVIGTVSFTGSMIAFGKLNGNIRDKMLPMQQVINIGLLVVIFSLLIGIVTGWIGGDNPMGMMYALLAISALYGVLFVMPIGGADMPVVISLLNSFTGMAAAFGGFMYDNSVMLTGGILVGSAGTVLTVLMCNAMNRSLLNVIVGAFGGQQGGGATGASGGTYKEISVSDLAVLMLYSKNVVIVPGYGLAVAQAQHTCHELEKVLDQNGVEVKYAIHPVAGRMPGHMNVLLAEADVSYDKLKEMEEINPEFSQTDVVLVLGANDVVNPAAKKDPSSPIYGMPILDVEDAAHIIVNKRSMKPGYAGIENQLFFEPKTSMLFGDAKDVLNKLVSEIKSIA
ncbi:MAG: NAD(P)(+) transhydrogenase (Re/Si-specific) subunit beta [Saprospiraceae bacterium]|nr:MAG: NAD/NADP transhydrogenase subunit beta [Bacteroidetes bacterium OLB9]MCO6464816.1 NAD(P)(+) transhydrogenase (Re/Si-specific) subunit beta [Saprospiraceae bacterium]MCZ2339152.1 NAD(P)(+) transhydrogenase (Re/Si-specific) subunit beta [Chitinophagales bacterium]